MSILKHELAGEVKISARGAVNLPAKLLRDLGWSHGDHVLIDVDEDRVVLTLKPESLADALAGRLTHLFPGGDDTRQLLDEERADWEAFDQALGVLMDAVDLDAAIGDAERAFIDTSVSIAFHSAGEAAHPAARHLIRRIEDDADPLVGYLSVITAAELLVRPLRTGSSDLQIMHRFLRQIPNLHIVEVDFEIAQQAANVRALTRLPLPYALIIGTALMAGCEAIVTNDREWSRRLAPLFPQFRWIYLGR